MQTLPCPRGGISGLTFSTDGDWLAVEAGEETLVKVYNCGYQQQWETPTKYPNTGIAPEGSMLEPSATWRYWLAPR